MERGASAAPAGKWITGFMENFSCIQSQDEITAIARASGGGGCCFDMQIELFDKLDDCCSMLSINLTRLSAGAAHTPPVYLSKLLSSCLSCRNGEANT